MTVSEDAGRLYRLQHFLAKAGIASRRAAEVLIKEGRVSVNGQIVTELGTKCSEEDTVLVDGKSIRPEEAIRYILLHKPAGFLCSSHDDYGRPLALDLLKESFSERLYSVGRLDFESSGLIIFTNDGDFAKKLAHPSSEIEKEYLVSAHTKIPLELLKRFQEGIVLEGIRYQARSCRHEGDTELRIVLIEGKNREIRKVFKEFGLRILTLVRVRIGTVNLGNLAEGCFRALAKTEIDSLLGLCEKTGRVDHGSSD